MSPLPEVSGLWSPFPGSRRYLFNVAYGVGKQALDRLSADTAFELRDQGVTVVSLWPGAVRTELIEKAIKDPSSKFAKVSSSLLQRLLLCFSMPTTFGRERPRNMRVSPLFTSPLIQSATTPRAEFCWPQSWGGSTASLTSTVRHLSSPFSAGRQPRSLRDLHSLLEYAGWTQLSQWVPAWVRLPYWVLTLSGSKF